MKNFFITAIVLIVTVLAMPAVGAFAAESVCSPLFCVLFADSLNARRKISAAALLTVSEDYSKIFIYDFFRE